MIMVSFRTKGEKEHLLDKARKMEEYSSMIVECLENSDYMDDSEYSERRGMKYRDDEEELSGRYGYRRYRMK